MSVKSKKRTLSVVVLLAFCFYFAYELYSRRQYAEALAEETLEDAVATVAVTHATVGDPVETITLPGNIEAWYQAPIYAQVSGYVTSWKRDYGAEVKKGDVLAQVHAPALLAQYEQAKAAMEAQRAKYELSALTARRYVAMRKSNAVSEQAISVKEANARVEQAQLRAAEHNVKTFEALLKFTTIVAPYDGVVVSREINVGDYVNKDGNLGDDEKGKSNLFTVADIHKMRLFVSVPERFGQFLKSGLEADVTVPQFPNRHYKAKFLTVAKGFGPNTRMAVTEFYIDNDDRSLWPGSYATVRLSANLDSHILTIPATSLVFQEDGTQVAVKTPDNKVHFQDIKVSKILDGTVDVLSGISADDAIIDSPSAALLEGDPVRVVKPAPGYHLAQKSGPLS